MIFSPIYIFSIFIFISKIKKKIRYQIFWVISTRNGFLWEKNPFGHKVTFNILPTAMINGPHFFKIRNKDFCNFLSIAMVMNRLYTFLVVYFPFPILIIYVFLTWNTFFNPKTLQKTLKNWVCSTPYIYTCVRPDVLIFSKCIV